MDAAELEAMWKRMEECDGYPCQCCGDLETALAEIERLREFVSESAK